MKNERVIVKQSVRGLVEFVHRQGNIDNRRSSAVTMQEGAEIHRRIQVGYRDFKAEVKLSQIIGVDDHIDLQLSGRADGIKDDGESIVIDEIKTTYLRDAGDHSFEQAVHWYQAMIYGALYSASHGKRAVTIQLTYYFVRDQQIERLQRSHDYQELAQFLADTVAAYRPWLLAKAAIISDATRSAQLLTYPYPCYREGQEIMAKAVFVTLRQSENAIVEAPTGIGKTIAALFGAIKAMGCEHGDRVFYLTAKNAQRTVALAELDTLTEAGFVGLAIALMAKQKICINDQFQCDPSACPHAKGHYDRVNQVLYQAVTTRAIYRPTDIQQLARDASVCPFELALDISDFASVVIGDYNYVFDPFVRLKRFFSSKSDAIILIDEAHNLHDRSREMYSASLDVAAMQHVVDTATIVDQRLLSELTDLIQRMTTYGLELAGKYDEQGLPADIVQQLQWLVSYYLDEGRRGDIQTDARLRSCFFDWYRLLSLNEDAAERSIITYDKAERQLQLSCLDASEYLAALYRRVRSVIAFSATLTPLSFYRDVLALKEAKRLQLASPFSPEHLSTWLCTRWSTYARDRVGTYQPIADVCQRFIAERPGNTMIFCPSYHYIEQLASHLALSDTGYDIVTQRPQLNEAERRELLAKFQSRAERHCIALLVTGGVFAEGIDLPGEQLTTVIVIGVGLPTISTVRSVMKQRYQLTGLDGFAYAYTFPGFAKVLQAAGRLIRSADDRGRLLLIGRRYDELRYRDMLPRHWHPFDMWD